MRRAPRSLVVALGFFWLAASAQAAGITVTVDRPVATAEDQLGLQVTVEGSREAQPEMPPGLTEDFQVYRQGTSSQVQIVNGRQTLSVTYNFILVPRGIGTFRVRSAKVEIEGRIYESRPFEIRIVEAGDLPRDQSEIFVVAEVSTTTPFVGQQVVYTWRFFRRVSIADAQLVDMPFEGFLVEDLGEVREYNTVRNGQRYQVSEIRKALFPQEVGKVTLEPSRIQVQVIVESRGRRRSVFDSVFGSQRAEPRTLATKPVEIEVRPLPSAPADFSGLVGKFGIEGEISKRDLQVGESATWKLTIRGAGNAQMIGEPRLPDLTRFKVYDDKPASRLERSGAELSGTRIFSKALVPLEAGELEIPPIRLVYFDPETASFKTASTGAVQLHVAPADGEEDLGLTESRAPGAGKVQVRILASDILPIQKGIEAVAPPPFGHRATPLWLAGVLLPPLLYLGLLVGERRRRHFASNVGLKRRKEAFGLAQKAIAEVEAAAKGHDTPEAARTASRVLREYIGDKLGLEGSALTPVEAAEGLRRAGIPDGRVAEARRRLERLEAAQYGGGAVIAVDSLAGDLLDLLRRLEKEIGA